MRGDSLSLGSLRTVRQWDVHSGQCLKSVLAHDSYIYRLAGGSHCGVHAHTRTRADFSFVFPESAWQCFLVWKGVHG